MRSICKAMKVQATIVFVSSFIFEFSFGQSGTCGGALVAETENQTITSSNHPRDYPNNLSCVWTLKAQNPGNQVEIRFEDVLTEPCCDVVTVRDGSSSSAPVIASFRGNSSGGSYVSTFGSLFIIFVTDESITYKGFQFHYQEVTVDAGCQEELTAETTPKLLLSPQWPLDYPANVFCKWTITADPEKEIYLIVLVLRTESCCDSLSIRDGLNETSRLLAELRGTTGGQLFSSSVGGILSVRFRTDREGNRIGFMARYFSVSKQNRLNLTSSWPKNEEECRGQLRVPKEGYGQITSPGFPHHHAEDLSCAWTIVAPIGQRIRIWFNYVNTQACCDWLKIRDGLEATSPKLGAVSGEPNIFPNFVSTENSLRVEFDSDSYINNEGFSAFYELYRENDNEFICGGHLRANSSLQYIASPNWPQSYNDSVNCTWNIEADPRMQVRLHFLGAITEDFYDKITVYDGNSTKDEMLFYWSGKTHKTPKLHSIGRSMTLTFTSDYAVHHGGFRAAYFEQRIVIEADEASDEE